MMWIFLIYLIAPALHFPLCRAYIPGQTRCVNISQHVYGELILGPYETLSWRTASCLPIATVYIHYIHIHSIWNVSKSLVWFPVLLKEFNVPLLQKSGEIYHSLRNTWLNSRL
jgi:hypothetical protein